MLTNSIDFIPLAVYLTVRLREVRLNSKDIIKMIEADGWQLIRAKGSHHHFKHPVKKGLVTIPHPKRTLPKGTVANILKQAGLK